MNKNPEKPKKVIWLAAVSFALGLFFLALFFYWAGKGAYHGVFDRRRLDVSLTDKEDGSLVLSEGGSRDLPVGQVLLLLSNGEKEEMRFSLYQKGKELCSKSLAPREECELSFDSSGGPLSLLVHGVSSSTAFLSDSESLSAISKRMEKGGDLVFFGDLSLDGAVLCAPFRLFGSYSFRELSMDTELPGRIALCPEKVFSGTLYVNAPACRLYFRRFTADYEKDVRDYYLKAKSLDGKALNAAHYPITDFAMLSRLADEELLPRLRDGAKLFLSEEITLNDSLVFSAICELEFTAPVRFAGNSLSFVSDGEGVYRVKTALGAGIDGASLRFLSPHAALVWEGEGTLPAMATVAKWSNLKSYNGSPLPFGGDGKALPSLTLFADGVDGLREDVVFQVEGNLLTARLPYLVSQKSLEWASFSLSCENGNATLEGNLWDGVIHTLDENGNRRSFGIGVLRDPLKLPVVHLETENRADITSKSQYVSATFALDGGSSDYDSLSETHIRIRGRGNSSWKWEKKPYKIHFDEPTSILGLPAAEEWALFSNYADKSLMRNRLAQVMASTLSFEYCPTQVCVDVFLNGEYLGVYTLGEHLEAGEGRVEVETDMSRTDCGYFLEAGGVVSGVDVKGMNYFHAGLVKFVLIKTPDYNQLSSEQFDFIHNYMLRADEAVKKGEGYEEYLDVDSLIDWLIMIELSCNTDCTWRRSTYFTKDPGGKLVMGPMWDFDLAFGNFSKDNPGDDTWVSSEPDDDYVGETWTTHLLEDPEFRARFRARWEEVGETLLNTALTEIEEQYLLLSDSAELNFQRWDILGKKVAFERHDTKDYKTYSSQIYYLQNFLINRAAWLDAQVMDF